jgi:hypothetical protein
MRDVIFLSQRIALLWKFLSLSAVARGDWTPSRSPSWAFTSSAIAFHGRLKNLIPPWNPVQSECRSRAFVNVSNVCASICCNLLKKIFLLCFSTLQIFCEQFADSELFRLLCLNSRKKILLI